MSEIQIYRAFRPFGIICDIAGGGSCNSKFEITFRLAASVDKLKQLKVIEISGYQLAVSWGGDVYDHRARSFGCFADSLKTPPDQQSVHNILNALDDDCLRTVFEHDQLGVDGLCTITSVCQRFERLGGEIFHRKYANKYTSFVAMLLSSSTIWQWEDYLSIFGRSIVSIDSRIQIRNLYTTLYLMAKHCPNMRQLTCFVSNPKIAIELRSLFVRLRVLTMTINGDFSFGDLFASDVDTCNLECLAVRSKNLLLAPIKLAHLTELKLEFEQLDEQESTEAFFALNPQLIKLHLAITTLAHTNYRLLLRALDLPNLHELTLIGRWGVGPTNSAECTLFHELKNLKRLTIQNRICSQAVIPSMLQAIHDAQLPLEYFSLTFEHPNVDVNVISRMQTIKTLYIKAFTLNDGQMMQLVEGLPHLTNVHIDAWKISLAGVQRVVQIANPVTKIRLELGAESVEKLIARRHDFAAIDRVLSSRGIQLFVRIPCNSNSNEPGMSVSYFG